MQSLLYIDLLPYDLCIETDEGYEVVIPKGVTIPARRSVEVALHDNHKELMVNVFRGKSEELEEFIVSFVFWLYNRN